jgi:hypothetical protein
VNLCYRALAPFRAMHVTSYWLLRNSVSETTCSEDLCQEENCQALQDYHTHKRWLETDTGRCYRRFHVNNYITVVTPEKIPVTADFCSITCMHVLQLPPQTDTLLLLTSCLEFAADIQKSKMWSKAQNKNHRYSYWHGISHSTCQHCGECSHVVLDRFELGLGLCRDTVRMGWSPPSSIDNNISYDL